MNDKETFIIYRTYLYLEGRDLVDLDESRIYLNALQDFDILERKANEDVFGEGIYEVSLNKEWFDDEGRFINGKILKKIIIDRGDEI